jgi:hypothetical protein
VNKVNTERISLDIENVSYNIVEENNIIKNAGNIGTIISKLQKQSKPKLKDGAKKLDSFEKHCKINYAENLGDLLDAKNYYRYITSIKLPIITTSDLFYF